MAELPGNPQRSVLNAIYHRYTYTAVQPLRRDAQIRLIINILGRTCQLPRPTNGATSDIRRARLLCHCLYNNNNK